MERYSLIVVTDETSPIRRFDIRKDLAQRAVWGAAIAVCLLLVGGVDYVRVRADQGELQKSSTNPGFGKGEGGDAPYSIWLWKGGGKMSKDFPNGTCKHVWQREIYLNSGKTDANSPLAKTISTSEAKRKGYKVPSNYSDVSIKPHNNKS